MSKLISFNTFSFFLTGSSDYVATWEMINGKKSDCWVAHGSEDGKKGIIIFSASGFVGLPPVSISIFLCILIFQYVTVSIGRMVYLTN